MIGSVSEQSVPPAESPTPEPQRLSRSQAVWAAVVGGVGAQLAGLFVFLIAGMVMAAYGVHTPEEIEQLLDTWPMLGLSVLTISVGLLLTAVIAPLSAGVRLRDALGLHKAPLGILLAAAAGTAGVGAAGDLLASFAARIAPELTFGTLDSLTQMARSEPFWLVFALFGLLPGICEEVFFRGMLQRSLGSSPRAVILVAVAFSLYHIDPHQAVGILPVAIYLGWLAARTGSTFVPIVAHIANNSFALVAANSDWLSFGYAADRPTPWWWLLLMLAVTAACVAVLIRRTRTAPTTSSPSRESDQDAVLGRTPAP